MLHSHNQLYTYTCGNIVNKIMMNETQFFRKIYLSHFIRNGTKGLCVRGVLETEQNFSILIPSSSGYCSTSFSSCRSAQPRALRAQLSAGSGSHCFELQQLTPNTKLTERPVAPGYLIVWHPPASCERHICTEFNPSTVKAIPWYLRPDAPFP